MRADRSSTQLVYNCFTNKAVRSSSTELTITFPSHHDTLGPCPPMMSISSGSSHPSARRSSLAVEAFRVFTASLGRHSETHLERRGQRFFSRAHDIATSISPSGWVATCSSRQIRLYNVRNANATREIPIRATLDIQMLEKNEQIRDIALSEDLLAVITHMRLLVYDEYRRNNGDTPVLVQEQRVDANESWTPRSVSVTQNNAPSIDGVATASVAVGGEGQSGVKIFRFRYTQGWNAESQRITLACPNNTGAIKIVGFSPHRVDTLYGPMVFALSTGNHLYCWTVGRNSSPGLTIRLEPSWHVDCNSSNNERVSISITVLGATLTSNRLFATKYQLRH